MQNSMPIYNGVATTTTHVQTAFEHMLPRSSFTPHEMAKGDMPTPETTEGAKRYLLTREEQRACDMATD